MVFLEVISFVLRGRMYISFINELFLLHCFHAGTNDASLNPLGASLSVSRV